MMHSLFYVSFAFAFALLSLTSLLGITAFREKSIRKQLKQWQNDDA